MSDDTTLLGPDPATWPPADLERVRASLAELREMARNARTREDVTRTATPEEIALATSDHQPWHCSATSSRTGLPCIAPRIRGGAVCKSHGGASRQAQEKARQRMLAEIDPTIGRLIELRDQGEHLPTALAAVKTLLDRVLPALRREDHAGAAKPQGPAIQIGINVGGVTTPQIAVGARPVPAQLTEGDVVEEDEDA